MDSIKYQDRMFLSNTHNNDFALHVKTYSIYSILFKMYTALGTDDNYLSHQSLLEIIHSSTCDLGVWCVLFGSFPKPDSLILLFIAILSLICRQFP